MCCRPTRRRPPCAGLNIFRVAKFREKPAAAVAKEYCDSGRFYWNSGIFVWKASTILAALREHAPQMMTHLDAIREAWNRPDFDQVLDREFMRSAASASTTR
ncbi:MAG: sugar phosphate nucleotidyltransferase [Pirellulales bacterium]